MNHDIQLKKLTGAGIDPFGNFTHGPSLQASGGITGKHLDTSVSLGDAVTNPLTSPNAMWSDSVYQTVSEPLPGRNYTKDGTVGKFEKIGTFSSANSVYTDDTFGLSGQDINDGWLLYFSESLFDAPYTSFHSP